MDQAEQLRNIIKKQNQKRHIARVITVTSGKGGVGKSSISINLAMQMKKLGKRVVILDADFGLANVEIMLGVRPQYNLADVLYRGKDVRDIITPGPLDVGFISGGSGIRELVDMSREQISMLVQKLYELDELADVIIIDTGAGISESVLEFVAVSSEVILVATPEPTSLTDAYALLKTLHKKEEFLPENTTIKLIANRTFSTKEGNDLYEKLNVVSERFLNFKLEYLGNIPQDQNISRACIQQKPIVMAYPNSPAAVALEHLAVQLSDTDAAVLQNKKGISQMFASFLHFRRK
jgi:flagellar biosynthesis protein FlhG